MTPLAQALAISIHFQCYGGSPRSPGTDPRASKPTLTHHKGEGPRLRYGVPPPHMPALWEALYAGCHLS